MKIILLIVFILFLGILLGKYLKKIRKIFQATEEDLKEEEVQEDLDKLQEQKSRARERQPKDPVETKVPVAHEEPMAVRIFPEKKIRRFKVRTIDNEFIYAVPCRDPGMAVLRLRNLFWIENRIPVRSIFEIEE